MKRIITIAAIILAVAIPVAAHAGITIGGCQPVQAYIMGHLEYLGEDYWWIECDGTGDIKCLLNVGSPFCETPVEDYEGFNCEDIQYYYFNSTKTSETDYENDDEGTVIMRWNKAELDDAIEEYCEE